MCFESLIAYDGLMRLMMLTVTKVMIVYDDEEEDDDDEEEIYDNDQGHDF